MSTTALRRRKPVSLKPSDHGKRMSLALFERAEPVDARTYELNKGVIEVSEIPSKVHRAIEAEIRRQFTMYEIAHPGVIAYQGNGSNTKLLVSAFESERHADWAVYTTPEPDVEQPWSIWKPALVIEIVSSSSIRRDYEENPAEYLAIGVSQYWILDPAKSQLLVKTSSGGLWQDKIYKPGSKVTCPLLPKFSFDLRKAFAAAKS